MKEVRVGLDLDGVIADIDLALIRLIDFTEGKEKQKELWRWYYRNRDLQLNPSWLATPEDRIVIVTSRYGVREITLEWLKKNGVQYDQLVFVPHEPLTGLEEHLDSWYEKQARKKAEVINRECIDVYFEDTLGVVKYLRKFCPNTQVLLYSKRINKKG